MTKKTRQNQILAKGKDGEIVGAHSKEIHEDFLPCDVDTLASFDKIYPEAPQEILKEWLAKSKTNREIELTKVKTEQMKTEIAKSGQSTGVLVVLVILGFALYLIKTGNDLMNVTGLVLLLLLTSSMFFAVVMGKKVKKSGSDIDVQ